MPVKAEQVTREYWLCYPAT